MRPIADLLPIGHAAADASRDKQLKSSFAAVLIAVALYSVVLALLPDRSRFEIVLDIAVIVIAAIALYALHATKSLKISFACMIGPGFPIAALFYFLHGNRDGDFYFFLLIPAAAVAFLGPRQSRLYFGLTLIVAAAILFVDPMLPKFKHSWQITPMNSQGWVFHAQDKYLMKTTEAATFFGVTSLIYFLLYSSASALGEANRRIESLLLNVLPPSVSNRLMDAERRGDSATIVEDFDEATILFADIVNFTELSRSMSPGELIGLLNDLFSAFDGLADKHGVEKIKTIGDAYMAVSGLPEPEETHAERIADMALEMLAVIEEIGARTALPLSIRIGINSGPVIAGVIGRRRFIYDLWGDAVNTASRMESHGAPGVIQAAAGTYDILKDRFEFAAAGEIDVKGRGTLAAWRLLGRR